MSPTARTKLRGFDFTSQMKRVCADVQNRSPKMSHLQVDRIAFSYVQARHPEQHGIQATLTPLRFKNGASTGYQNDRLYRIQEVYGRDGRQMVYLLNFYMPRFMNLSFDEKMTTLFHELLHINPSFNGDLRRFPGRCYMHSSSEKNFDRWATRLAKDWLARKPPTELYGFLELNFDQLTQKYGPVIGEHFTHPKLFPVKVAA